MSDFRRVTASGTISITDDEFFEDEHGSYHVRGSAVVGATSPTSELEIGSKCVGGEVRFEIELVAEYEADGDVKVTGEARLFEGTSCSTMDQEADQSISVTVPKDGAVVVKINLLSKGFGGGDAAKGRIVLTNIAQPREWRSPRRMR